MRCPGCKEETFEEELIQGKCPLCGTKVMETREAPSQPTSEPFIKCISDYEESPLDFGDAPVRDIINDIFEDIFSGVERTLLISYMAYDISQNTGLEIKQARNVARQVVDMDEASFEFDVVHAWYDEFKLKKCARCGRLHLMIGKKVLKGRIEDGVGEYDIEYVCRRCS
ncbi:hypothetical protein [Methanocella sp. MCL-LM]|uniref:hypothetical protein n=1 Tax=Methanocella sp. MCL-LM TaxID=3412035 RepID=UPI003C752D79